MFGKRSGDMAGEWSMEPISVIGILVSLLCGLIIGLERQLSQKPAGIRTSALICLGTYIFTSIGTSMMGEEETARIVAQIITGIGFIGAGVMMAREGIIIGVTSASVIWVLAGIGILIGFNKYLTALVLSLATVFILTGVSYLEIMFKSLRRGLYKRIIRIKEKRYRRKKEA